MKIKFTSIYLLGKYFAISGSSNLLISSKYIPSCCGLLGAVVFGLLLIKPKMPPASDSPGFRPVKQQKS